MALWKENAIATATATASCSTSTSTIVSAKTTTIIVDAARDGSVTGVIVVSDTVFACAVGVFEFVVGILPFAVTGAFIFPHLLSIRVSTAFAFAHRVAFASAFATAEKGSLSGPFGCSAHFLSVGIGLSTALGRSAQFPSVHDTKR
ncbi:hypothetical protein JHK84_055309 [Glycine max]|nr:hypothetical protein JHK84_055309 [Glycine max]